MKCILIDFAHPEAVRPSFSRCFASMAVIASFVNGQSPTRHTPATSETLGPPPVLSMRPAGTEWPEGSKKKIETVLAKYPEDQVSTYLTLRETLDDKDSKLNAEQKQWLEESVVLISSRAKAVLRRDLDTALSRQEFRAAFIAWSTMAENGFETDIIASGIPTVAELLKRAPQKGKGALPVWDIQNTTGEFLPSYTENVFMKTSVTIKPDAGRQLLRVKARVTNISPSSDPAYVTWSLGTLKRAFFNMQESPDSAGKTVKRSSRLAGDRFIFAVSREGESFPCRYVSANNVVLGSNWVRMIAGGNSNPSRAEFLLKNGQPGSMVGQGTSFDIDVMFAVPQGTADFRLLIVGSQPVAIKVQSK